MCSISNSQFHSSDIPAKFNGIMDYSKLRTEDIIRLDNKGLSEYIFFIQDDLQSKLSSGRSIDDIIDQEDPFEALEPLLPQEVYPILVLAIINNIRSDTIMEALLEGFQKGIKQYKKSNS